MESGLCLHVAHSFLLQYVVHPLSCCILPLLLSYLWLQRVFLFIVLLLQYPGWLSVCSCLLSRSLPASLSVPLLRDRLLLVPVVVFFPLFFCICASHCCFLCSFFLHFSFITTAITSLTTLASSSFLVPPTTYISSATFSFSPSPLRLFLRPQDVRRCPVGPEVKPRLSTSHPTRHFDSSISSLCVVCVVLSVSWPA